MSRIPQVRVLGVLAAVTLTLSGCGSSGTDPVAGAKLPARAATTTAPPPSGAPEGGGTPGGGSGGGGGGTAPSSDGATTDVALYFTRGEQVERVTRRVPKVTRIGAEALRALLAGPNAAERAAGLSTAIPANTQFRDLVIEGGQARVDLSRAFESGGGGLGLTLRLAQVACTLDAFPTVSGVRFALDGETVDVLSGDGVVVDRPVTCDSYGEYLSESPAPPVRVVEFDGIWPFVTAEEAATYAAGSGTTFLDPVATARVFAQEYLEMAEPVTFPFRATGPGQGEVGVGFGTGEGGAPLADPRPTTLVTLIQIDAGDRSPWTVTGAASPDIVVDSPASWSRIGSPLAVSGRAHAFEGTVQVRVREQGMAEGDSLGGGFVTGGGDAVRPFSGEISFRSPSRSSGAVVFYEASAADGSTLRATVVPVRF